MSPKTYCSQIQLAPESTIPTSNNPNKQQTNKSSDQQQIKINSHHRRESTSAGNIVVNHTGSGNNRQPENPVLSFNVEITPPQQQQNSSVVNLPTPDGATCLPDVVPKINQRLLKHR